MEEYPLSDQPLEQAGEPDDLPEWLRQMRPPDYDPTDAAAQLAVWQEQLAAWQAQQPWGRGTPGAAEQGVYLGEVGPTWRPGQSVSAFYRDVAKFIAPMAAQEAHEHPDDQEAQERYNFWLEEVRKRSAGSD